MTDAELITKINQIAAEHGGRIFTSAGDRELAALLADHRAAVLRDAIARPVEVEPEPRGTLRDSFAADALQGLIASRWVATKGDLVQTLVATAYEFADAMIEARKPLPAPPAIEAKGGS